MKDGFSLEVEGEAFYCRPMKRISFVLMAWSLCALPALRAQDAATEERLNKLSGQIEDLKAGQDSLRKQLDGLSREIQSLREQAGKSAGDYASQEELKRLADALKEVDRKRLEDAEKVHNDLVKLGKELKLPPPAKKSAAPIVADRGDSDKPAKAEQGFDYTIQKGDTLSLIVQAYREKNIKVSTDQILKANPGLKPERMHVGQKIFIPAPPS